MVRFALNPLASRDPYQSQEACIVSMSFAQTAYEEVSTWPGYRPTPLRRLESAARHLRVGAILYKDESARFGQGSFKALGGAYAATLRLRTRLEPARATLCCATDGNHGRSVAFAAKRHGCRCVVFMHHDAPEAKAAAIRNLGADVLRTPGNYDDSVREAEKAALEKGWILIQDTSSDPEDETTRLVMRGYGVMLIELFEQQQLERQEYPTHVFLQAGVGGLAASVIGPLADHLGQNRPRCIIVEPDNAACLFESALRLAPVRIGGDLVTDMAMLSAGEPSRPAWAILQRRADAFLTVSDEEAHEARKRLAPIDVGVSGAAGFAGFLAAANHRDLRAILRLDETSRVLIFGTEGGA